MAAGTEAHTYVAFVRAVMVGRDGLHRKVLLDQFVRAGARQPQSFIATGNVSFVARPDRLAEIVDAVEGRLARVVGRPAPLFVRSLDELWRLIDSAPFDDLPWSDVHDRLVMFFRDHAPGVDLPISAPRGDFDVFRAGPRELFAITHSVPRGAQAPGGVVERLTGEQVTTRAWSTVLRIATHLAGSV